MRVHTWYVGIGHDAQGMPLNPKQVEEARQRAMQYASSLFGGCTVTEGVGQEKLPGGKLGEPEPTLVFSVVQFGGETPDWGAFTLLLAEWFWQREVLHLSTECKVH